MLTDGEIIELFFARSERAVSELENKYGALAHSAAFNILGSREDAEECVNDAYLGVWNAIPPERPKYLRAYVVKITRNLALKAYWRSSAVKRGGACPAVEELSESLPSPATVEAELDARELSRALEAFLDTLSAENRVIFVRRHYFGDSCKAIARLTGMTEKNVSVRLSRTRAKLKQYLTESGVTEWN